MADRRLSAAAQQRAGSWGVPHLFDGVFEEVNKPGKGVLIHGLHIGQSADGKKEHRDMARHILVAQAGLIDLQYDTGSLSRRCGLLQGDPHWAAACSLGWPR